MQKLIAPFDPWKSKSCTCPNKYSLNPYTGCAHGGLYCYSSSYIPYFFNPRQKNILRWNAPFNKCKTQPSWILCGI